MTYPGPSGYDLKNLAAGVTPEPAPTPPAPEPPVNVRVEATVSRLAHDFDLEYDEAAAIREILHGDLPAAGWHLAAELQKQATLGSAS